MIDSNLHNTPLFSALDEEAAIALKQSMVPQTVKKGQDLFKEGDAGDRLYVVTEGKIKLSHASGDGRESLLMVLGPGDMFGELSLFDPGPRTATATAITDSAVLGLGNTDLNPWLAGRPEVSKALLQALAHRLREKFGTKTNDGLYVHHDLTQEELAQLVGASRETVNKALADFASRGWVKLETRSVEILDVERLSKRAR
jgi:CRP-like cAMP-binding protein